VIVNPNLEPRNGQIVAAILDDAAVVKRFYKKKNEIELHSENPDFKPIVIDKKHSAFRVVGIVVGVYRSMEKRAG
jgi:repressor LexA